MRDERFECWLCLYQKYYDVPINWVTRLCQSIELQDRDSIFCKNNRLHILHKLKVYFPTYKSNQFTAHTMSYWLCFQVEFEVLYHEVFKSQQKLEHTTGLIASWILLLLLEHTTKIRAYHDIKLLLFFCLWFNSYNNVGNIKMC